MEGFKSNAKMQCFKEGGQVKYESRKEHKEEMKADIDQDKKIIKKAIAMHDKQEHKGEKTDLSKLNKGGRAKKAKGTVKKFCGGKGVKKYAEGGSVEEEPSMLKKGVNAVKSAGKTLYENVVGTPEQNKTAQESMNKQAAAGSKLAKFFGGKADAESAPVEKCGGGRMKRGGKVC